MSIRKVSAKEFLGAASIIAPGSARPDIVKWHQQRKKAKAKSGTSEKADNPVK